MPKKTFTPEQIVGKLRQIEVIVSQGKPVPLACKEAGVTAQTYDLWRKEYGGLQTDQARKLKDLQKENAQAEAGAGDGDAGEADPEGHRRAKLPIGFA